MNESQSKERQPYPRYETVEGEKLEQGDILLRCPVVIPTQILMWPVPEDQDLEVEILLYDLVVLTQSCDLELRVDKKTKAEFYGVDMVTLCPHWDLSNVAPELSELAQKGDPQKVNRDKLENIAKGQMPRYHLLGASESAQVEMGVRVVDLSQTISLPLTYVHQLSKRPQKRLRLGSPYKEHLAQAFARLFMRIGLPQNIELP